MPSYISSTSWTRPARFAECSDPSLYLRESLSRREVRVLIPRMRARIHLAADDIAPPVKTTLASMKKLLYAGVVGPLLFIVIFLIEGLTRPGCSAWRHYVSQLATGDGGWMQVVNFLVGGTLVLAFAIELRQALNPGDGSRAKQVRVDPLRVKAGILGCGLDGAVNPVGPHRLVVLGDPTSPVHKGRGIRSLLSADPFGRLDSRKGAI